MSANDLIIFVHVLAWVFWLGTDIGVFVGAKFSEKAELSVETRLTVLKVAMLLDAAPRIAVPIVFATGVSMANTMGVDLIPELAGWLIGGFWLAVVLTVITSQGQGTLGHAAMHTQLAINALVFLGMGGLGVATLLGYGYMPDWLAVKWIAYAVIAAAAIRLEATFKPAVADYVKLELEGASDELNASLSNHMKPVYNAVLLIYAGTITAAYFGLIKPF